MPVSLETIGSDASADEGVPVHAAIPSIGTTTPLMARTAAVRIAKNTNL